MKKYNRIICFKGNTTINTPEGLKKIKDINPGDIVYSFNLDLNIRTTSIVKRVANSKHNKICKISFNDNSILEMTLDHPIWVIGKGWASISQNERYNLITEKLNIGDKCLSLNSENMTIKTVKNIEIIYGEFTMYNISGGNHNNYFANGILAHDENMLSLDLIRENIQYSEV